MQNAFVLRPGQSRNGRTLNIFGDLINVLLAGRDTSGGYSVMLDRTEPNCGPPLHRHNREDEFFQILDGQFRFEVDGQMIDAGPGSSVYAARGTAHTFQNVGSTVGRMLVITQPAGLDSFFEDLAAATSGQTQPDPSVVVPVFEKHGLELLGPPLAARKSAAA
jgi:quercetin dioxygenase-like cupin family protein